MEQKVNVATSKADNVNVATKKGMETQTLFRNRMVNVETSKKYNLNAATVTGERVKQQLLKKET